MGKVIVLVETAVLSVPDHRREAPPQLRTLDVLELLFKIDPAMPDFQRRQIHEAEHMLAIGGDCARREAARPLVRHVRRPGGDRDAGRQTLDVDGEIDAGQSLVEIVDVEEDGAFGRIERAEVHQVTVAAGLHRRPGDRLAREIGRHHRRRAAQKPERVRHHALVALRQKRGHPLGVGFGQNGDGIPVPGTLQLGMGFARRAGSQRPAVLISIGAILQSSGHGEHLRIQGGCGAGSCKANRPAAYGVDGSA